MSSSPQPEPLDFTPQPPVKWFRPSVLLQTGLNLSISKVFGEFADKRELQISAEAKQLNLAQLGLTDRGELWFDYVCDVGDGFDATASIAQVLARPQLALAIDGGASVPTERGEILVMGGDEVYPFGSVDGYQDRLVGPYRAMLPNTTAPHPRVLALAGNHDWYDGLTSFLRIFGGVKRKRDGTEEHRWIGGWQTAQRRSYFAVRLPQRWWLWGIDIQLDTYIDDPQLAFFSDVARLLAPDDGVILCSAKPSWIDQGDGPHIGSSYAVLDFFERELIRPSGARLRLSLTGDHHYYARYEGVEDDVRGAQKLIAGGGGAYLAATHHLPPQLSLPSELAPQPRSETRHYRLGQVPGGDDACYPSKSTSKRLRFGVWRLPFRNGRAFPAVVGALYLLWAVTVVLPNQPTQGIGDLAVRFVSEVGPLLLAGVLLLVLKAFTHDKRMRAWPLAVLHVLLHLLAVLLLVKASEFVVTEVFDKNLDYSWRWLVVALVGLAGAAVGCWVMGLYLVIADHYEVNTNELFAAQGIEDYKGFLRLHIDRAGELTVYPVKVERVCHRWRRPPSRANDLVPILEPEPGHELRPALIEPPIVITRMPPP